MKQLYSIRMRAEEKGRHISGAEGLIEYSKIKQTVQEMIERSFSHPRGKSDLVTLTIEEVSSPIKRINPLFRIKEVQNDHETTTLETITELLQPLLISENLIHRMYEFIMSDEVLPGALLLDMHSGEIIKHHKDYIRVSRFDWEEDTKNHILNHLGKASSARVLEALALASKVQASGVFLELCCSDDPDYTTGYISFCNTYYRIPNMKALKSNRGGRVFLIDPRKNNVEEVVHFLEKTPVLIGGNIYDESN